MTGDVVGAREAFLETVEALRSRQLPASDVATLVRLSKTRQAYLAKRSSHAEPQYEALLSAGRTNWTPGERVRFYRARGGKAIWLPDETEEFLEDSDQEAGYRQSQDSRRDYDVEYYLQLLMGAYASRLRKAFAPTDFELLFRIDQQLNLFEQQPIEAIEPR